MHLGDLPPEIHGLALQFCSPADLAVLSRTHTSLRDAAEYVLYSRIDICADPSDLILVDYYDTHRRLNKHKSPLHTLITNSQKASIVKALYVDFGRPYMGFRNNRDMIFVAEELARALEKMTALVDLCIGYDDTWDPCGGRISQVIRGGYFKLNSLCLEAFHDIEGIIAGQSHLQLFGIFSHIPKRQAHMWEILERFSQTPSHRRAVPSFFVLGEEPNPVIYMLPFLYHPGEVPKVCRETATLINKWPDFRRCGLGISLLGISEKNINLVEETMVAMDASLRSCCHDQSYESVNVIIHEKYIQKPWRFPAFFEPIMNFKRLLSLKFLTMGLHDHQRLRQMADDMESCLLAKGLAWGHMKWPNLQRITLWSDLSEGRWRGQSSITLEPRSSRWYINEISSS